MWGGGKTEGQAARLSPFNHFAGPGLRPEEVKVKLLLVCASVLGHYVAHLQEPSLLSQRLSRIGPAVRQPGALFLLASSPSDPDD